MLIVVDEKFGLSVVVDINGGIVIGVEVKCVFLCCYDVCYKNSYRFGVVFFYKECMGVLVKFI